MENAYKYLFPFEKVPQGAAIVIYGAGILGQEYLKQIKITNYCRVIGFADKNFMEYKNASFPVYAPEKIENLKFDFVVVAIRGSLSTNHKKFFEQSRCGRRKDNLCFRAKSVVR